jgi:hypothetical protein
MITSSTRRHQPRCGHERIQRGGSEIDRVHACEAAATASTSGPDGIDDIGCRHDVRFLLQEHLIDRLRGRKASVLVISQSISTIPKTGKGSKGQNNEIVP